MSHSLNPDLPQGQTPEGNLTLWEIRRFLLATPKDEVLDLILSLETKMGSLAKPRRVYTIHLLDFGETWIRVIRAASDLTGEPLSVIADEITVQKIPYVFGPFSSKEKANILAQVLRDAGALVQVTVEEDPSGNPG